MNIKLNKKSISMIAVYAIILVVYILVFCLIPFPKIAASYISFAFTIVSILASLGITAVAFKDDDALVSKIYGFPVFRIGYIYVATQFILGLIICIVASFVAVPYWVALLLSIILLGAAGIGVIAADNTRDTIKSIDNETERVTRTTKIFKLDIATIVDLCEDAEVKKDLEKLSEDMRFSDPVSSEATEESEAQLLEEIRILRGFIENNDKENSLKQIKKTSNLLAERNRICKAFKK